MKPYTYKLIIRRKGHRPQRATVNEGETIIGRGEDAGLVLPHISVSRHHARFVAAKNEIWLEDLSSRNGTKVNNTRVDRYELQDGDEIQIGQFILTLKTGPSRPIHSGSDSEESEDYTLSGHRTGFLRRVTAVDGDHAHETSQLTYRQLEELRKLAHIQQHAHLAREGRKDLLIEDGLRFSKVDIDPGGLGLGGQARIRWAGKQHVLEKLGGMFFNLKVNGDPVKEKVALQIGDRVEIGKAAYSYEI